MMSKFKFNLFSAFTLVMLILFIISCERKTSPADPNEYPNTSMANIPRDNDTTKLFALLTLHWDGEDFDGFISGYEYRYKTYRKSIGDSIVQDWKFTDQTSLTIPFLSDDSVENKQVFEIRAIDDQGDADPTPATKNFYTYRTDFPITEILYPIQNRTYFVVEQLTDWWGGIELEFKAYDPDIDKGGGITEYGWAVDGGDTTWTKDTAVVIIPDKFQQPLVGEHKITVTSRDNTNLIDPIGATVTIKLVSPAGGKNILIIDATTETNFPGGLTNKATDAQVDAFYSEIFPNSDQWDLRQRGFPPVDSIGQYKLVVWHSDDLPFTQPHVIANYTDQIKDYLNVGGNIIIGGWRILKSFAWTQNFPITFPPESFVNEYLHIVSVDESSFEGDMTYADGLQGLYSSIRVDSVKMAGFPYFGKLSHVNLISLPAGFTDGIYFYQNPPNSQYFEFRGKTIGLRYYGTAFQSVVLGFPMYFLKLEDAKVMAQEILAQMGI